MNKRINRKDNAPEGCFLGLPKTYFSESGWTMKAVYAYYRRHVADYDNKGPVCVLKTQFMRICKKFNRRIMDAVVKDGICFKMPYRVGYMRIEKGKPEVSLDENGEVNTKYLQVDWKSTRELWRETYGDKTSKEIDESLKEGEKKPLLFYLNENTGGYIVGFKWKKGQCANRLYYTFKPTRVNKKLLSAETRKNKAKIYVEKEKRVI